MHHIQQITATCASAANVLSNISEEKLKSNYKTVQFNCADLDDLLGKGIIKSNEFKALYKIRNPALYWFEIISFTEPKVIIDAFKNCDKSRSTPALRNNLHNNTNVLYVGKVKKMFGGRMNQHFGYSNTKATQGLQLYHWAKAINLNLKLHIYEFDKDMADLILLLEIAMAKQLKPLIGKHS